MLQDLELVGCDSRLALQVVQASAGNLKTVDLDWLAHHDIKPEEMPRMLRMSHAPSLASLTTTIYSKHWYLFSALLELEQLRLCGSACVWASIILAQSAQLTTLILEDPSREVASLLPPMPCEF